MSKWRVYWDEWKLSAGKAWNKAIKAGVRWQTCKCYILSILNIGLAEKLSVKKIEKSMKL